MKIGELAKQTGLTASRIRFYEASGLIHAVARKANGYREYPQEAVWTLEIITQAQKAGFALDEIRHLLPTSPNNWEHDELLIGLKRKVAEIEALQKRLEYNRAQLLVVIAGVESGAMPCADKQEWLLDRLRE